MKVSWSLILLAAAAASQAVLIDDFTTGEYSSEITSGYEMDLQHGDMLSGARGTYMRVLSNPLETPALSYVIQNGVAIVSSGTLLRGFVEFAYGYALEGDTPIPQDMNLDLSGDSAFRIHFLANDLPLSVAVLAGQYNTGFWRGTIDVPGGQLDPFTVDVPFSSFEEGIDWADVDQIVFDITGSPSGDYAISRLETVPEPASIAVLAMGAAALIARKRRSR